LVSRFGGWSGLSVAALLAGSSALHAAEYPAGDPQIAAGMEIAAVYLQPIEMEPPGMMRAAAESGIHLEADIHATRDNRNGYAEGDWIPYLDIAYELVKVDDNSAVSGKFMAMVASDGPHYGDNIKVSGPGLYRLSYTISPPGSDAAAMFGRHVDKETGVAEWFAPFTVTYEFVYAGVGKTGSY
jgi:uncharacterized protein involved in high-affinity Fe2+ transport